MTNSSKYSTATRLDARLVRYSLLAGAAIASTQPASAGVITAVGPGVDLLSNVPFFYGGQYISVEFFTGATIFSTLGLRIGGFSGGGPRDYFFIGGHSGATNVAFNYSIGSLIGNTGTGIPV